MDFTSAFDFVNRELLQYGLKEIGINGSFLKLVKALYTGTECAIKLNGELTDWFSTTAGVRQGQNDSATMFSILVNKFALKIKSMNKGIQLRDFNLSILLYADDIVLVSDKVEHLQQMINELNCWCSKWRMIVNPEKTQVIHFRPKKSQKTDNKFTLGNITLNVVSSYKYLGCTFNEFLQDVITGNSLAEGAKRALGKVLSKYYSNKGLGFKTYKALYETCVCPIMDYGSGVWGYSKNEELENIHLKAMRSFLGVNKYGTKAGIEGEIAWLNPNNRRKLEMLRLWNKLTGLSDNRLPKIMFNDMIASNATWIKNLRIIFTEINCADVFENNATIINFKEFREYVVGKLLSMQQTMWLINVNNKPKLHLYGIFKNTYETENYCTIGLKRGQRSLLAKLRLGTLPINIELGRYNGIPRNERWCPFCKTKIEDEIHIMFYCPLYQPLRQTLLSEALQYIVGFYVLSDAVKIEKLTGHVNVIRKTAKYLGNILTL